VTNITNTKVVGPASAWEPTNKTISIRETTRKRLQSYGTHYGSIEILIPANTAKTGRVRLSDGIVPYPFLDTILESVPFKVIL
jgi:hypothetical protein